MKMKRMIPKHKWKDNIKMNFKGTKCVGADWIKLAQDMIRIKWRYFVDVVMNILVS